MTNNQNGRLVGLKRITIQMLRTQTLRVLFLLVIAQCFAVNAIAAPKSANTNVNDNNEQIAQLLDLLGVRALIEQTPTILATAIEAETQFLGTQPQPANWRRELEAQLKSPIVLQSVVRFLRERSLSRGNSGADPFLRAQQRLQEPIAKRARYFDLAMTQPGAEKNLREFFIQNGLAQGTKQAAKNKPAQLDNASPFVTEARRVLLREIDTASSSSLFMATLQSAIAARVRQASSGGVIDMALLQDEIAERQRHLAPLAVDYLFYDYRYLRDDELHDYRDLLRDDSVQWLFDLCYQAVLVAVVGEITPPPAPSSKP